MPVDKNYNWSGKEEGERGITGITRNLILIHIKLNNTEKRDREVNFSFPVGKKCLCVLLPR